MHTVELLDQALAAARKLGIRIRQEWLTTPGGLCEFNGKRWLFIDQGAPPAEQLGVVLDALRAIPDLERIKLSHDLQQRLQLAKSA